MSLNLPPGPKGIPVLGNLLERKKDPLGFFQRVQAEYGPIAYVPMAHIKAFLVSDPVAVKYVLQDAAGSFIKGKSYDGLRQFLGDGIFTAIGNEWKEQKQTLQPLFQRSAVSAFVPVFTACISDLFAQFEKQRERNGSLKIDLHETMTHLTLEIISRTMFGTKMSEEHKHRLGEMVTELVRITNEYTLSPIKAPKWMPTRLNREIRENREELDRIIFAAIDERLKHPGEGRDLVSHLMSVKRPGTDAGFSKQLIRDQIVTFFLAGHETTASTLNWCLWHIATDSALQQKLASPAVAASAEQVSQADWLLAQTEMKAVMMECMRLYPPVWVIPRQAAKDEKIMGYDIPAQSIVLVVPYVMHRMPSHWDEPTAFKPERHMSDESFSRYLFLPFSVGPRTCMGELFACLEILATMSQFLKTYQIKAVPEGEVGLDPSLTLRPKGRFMVELTKRLR